jgi:hypothetical protein
MTLVNDFVIGFARAGSSANLASLLLETISDPE